MLKRSIIGVFLAGFILSCGCQLSSEDHRTKVEKNHGIVLPVSATDIQCRGDRPTSGDGGTSCMFEMKRADLEEFLSQLKIKARNAPATLGPGDPCVNGRNVWPQDAPTFIPGNDEYGGFENTWQGSAVPSEMLSCDSPIGDWLHVEIWKIGDDDLLVKMYTDWN